MAKADALRAPGRTAFEWRSRPRRSNALIGNARLIAGPAYGKLLAAEPILRRLIPSLIILFLIVVACLRFLSMMSWHDDIERNAKTILTLSAGELAKLAPPHLPPTRRSCWKKPYARVRSVRITCWP